MYFTIYSHNIPVRGERQSLIYDLQHEELIPIPNALYGLLAALRERSVEEIKAGLGAEDGRAVDRYLDFLREKDLGASAGRRLPFAPLDLQWHCPSLVSTAVLEYGFEGYSLAGVLKQLNGLLCKNVELRLSNVAAHLEELSRLLEIIERGVFSYLVVWLFDEAPELRGMIERESAKAAAVYVGNGQPAEEAPVGQYIVNMNFFAEAQGCHPYFNKRVCVSGEGSIKRCLTHGESFGHVEERALADVIRDPGFTEWWDVHPGMIEDLGGSAFRYAIYSNRALVRTANNQYRYKN